MWEGIRRRLALLPGEAAAVLWAAALFFCLLASYFVLRPIRDALPLDGDPKDLPGLFTATFVAMLAVTPVWGAMVRRWPRRRLVPICYHAFFVQLIALYVLVELEVAPRLIAQVFFVWTSVFNLFVVSVFWSLAADLFGPEQGRRLFGPIAAGGTIGALVGPSLTSALVERIGVAGMLLVSASLLQLAIVCVYRLDRAVLLLRDTPSAPTATPSQPVPVSPPASPDAPIGGGLLAGLARILRSQPLRLIAVYVLCTTIAATFLYLEQGAIAKAAFPDRDARTAFFANIDLWTNLATLAIQTLLTARLLRWLGPGALLALLPIAQAAGLGALALAPTVAALVAVQVVGRTTTNAFARPARELLFTTLPREDKYKAKNVIDTLIYRFGDMGSAWLHKGLVALCVGLGGLALAFAPLAGVWVLAALALGRTHRRLTAAASTS